MNLHIEKFVKLAIIFLFFHVHASTAGLTNETYYEVTVPSAWFDAYSKQRMITLLGEFNKTDANKRIFNELRKLSNKPKLNVDIYKDRVEGEKNLAWVVRFTISTAEVGLKQSKEVVKQLGANFGKYIERYRKAK